MQFSDDSSNDSSEQRERIKRAKSEKKKLKRKLVESRDDSKPGTVHISNRTLDTFLEARKHLQITNDKESTQPVKISADEEVWIFQCPKNIETDDLVGRKLILPQPIQIIESKRGNREFECKLELTKQENHLTMICPTNGGFPEAVSVKQAGMIAIRERIKLPRPREKATNDDQCSMDKQFYYPTNLKIRHPLLGVNFDRIVIKQELDDFERISPKRRKSNGHPSSDRIKVKQEPQDEINVSPSKKEKKRSSKRQRESIEIKLEPDEEEHAAKRQKHSKKTRNGDDLLSPSPNKHKRTSIKIEPDSHVMDW